jgi:hypothetical protein
LNIHDIEKRMADLADQMKRMQVELDAAKAAAAAKKRRQVEFAEAQAAAEAVAMMEDGETVWPMCMCDYPEWGCRRCRKYCVYCEGEETKWACTCAVSSRCQQEGAIAVGVFLRRRVKESEMARPSIMKPFSDMTGVIRRRCNADQMHWADMALQKRYLVWLSKEDDADMQEELTDRIAVLQAKPPVLIGFADQPVEESVKADLCVVSAFQDEFSSGGPGSGNFLRFYFVCQATHGSSPRCFTIKTSKGWRRKNYPTLENRMGQAYYCDCNARYNQNWGCLVELSYDGVFGYMRASVPDTCTLDLLAAKAEEKFYKPGMSAAELFNRLPSVPPQSSTFVKMVSGSKDVMKISDPEFFDSLNVLPWTQIMNMAPQ